MQHKFNHKYEELKKEINKYRHKLNLKPSNRDFVEEIKVYLNDGISDLKKEGYSEEEALSLIMEKFDEAELQENFEDFMKEFNDFGMEEQIMNSQQWYKEDVEIIGMLYGGFSTIGVALGALIGFIMGGGLADFLHTGWIHTLIGLVVGAMIGAGLGQIGHAIVVAKSKKK